MKALTILVAEDDLLSRMVLERSVIQWGHQMVSAVDGESALETLRTRSIDVCLLDWDMPKMTGIEICKWLRTNAVVPKPYVILITGREQPEEIQTGYEAGADDYIMKPCDLRYLRRRIATVADKLSREEAVLDRAAVGGAGNVGIATLSPLDIYLSDLQLMRRKS
ncbi:MAG TPA: response regulator [Candidatus Acidoferrum sp.]|nr:response regulator [Candidatus Acidoferrum sp.]